MKKQTNSGFIKILILIVVGGCAVFILLAVLAQYVGPELANIADPSRVSNNSSGSSLYDFNAPNPLLPSVDTPIYGGSNSYYSDDMGGSITGPRSPYAGKISLGSGNASYSIQPYEEYVTLQNQSNASITVTGWTLTNGKNTRPLQNTQNNYFYSASDSATIGTGTEFLDPNGTFQTGPIKLAPGDSAIVTTGGPFSQYPFSIYTSFRENICEGYLENYPFMPQMSQSCPYATNDPDIRTVTDQCYDYVQTISRCENPEKNDKKNFDLQTTQCRNFMSVRFNYPSCVARNRYTQGFAMNQWRIFLGKGRQLWADRRETITLYDNNNLIVDQISY